LTARRVASSADASLTSGRSFTCTTIFTAHTITPAYDTTLGAKPRHTRGRTVACSPHAHLAFTPKYRRGPFTGEILARCEEITREACADFGAELREVNGEADHVHLLVHYPPKVSLARLAGSLKGVSARRLRQEFPGHIRKYLWGEHFWSPSYFAASCGGAPLSIIKEYIEQQKRPG
jgi:putative transposase